MSDKEIPAYLNAWAKSPHFFTRPCGEVIEWTYNPKSFPMAQWAHTSRKLKVSDIKILSSLDRQEAAEARKEIVQEIMLREHPPVAAPEGKRTVKRLASS